MNHPNQEQPTNLVRLDSRDSTWVLRVDQGPPRLLYWGQPLDRDANLNQLLAALKRPVPHGMLDREEPLSWLPEAGQGFTSHPGVIVHRDGGDFLTQLETATVESTTNSLRVRCTEVRGGFSVTFDLKVDEQSDVLDSVCTIENQRDGTLNVEWLAAGTIPFASSCDELLLFDGRWCREFSLERRRLGTGLLMKENRLGRTSHHSFPATLCGCPGFSEDCGETFGFHLGWSGNHRWFAERTRDGRVQLQFGELLEPSEIRLEKGESYSTPKLYGARSADGLNGLSQRFHDFVRRRILPQTLSASPRPVHFNTWETLYFDHSEEKTLALVEEAASIGAERFVLDDGWFEGRDTDHAGLGDWRVCPKKYPGGLEPIVSAVLDAGLQFGLWIEPEMINQQSALFEQHPEWVLGDPDREQPLGRNQYALNLCRADVQAHLSEAIVGLIDRYKLSYLKWDMNRDLCHVVVDGKPGSHRMTLATYQLFDTVRSARPGVEIETCSSGGGRCDFEILRRTDRVWVSDSHDPKERQEIERGFSLFLPPEIMGSHVGSQRSETSGRQHAIGFRAATAMFGHMGLEASLTGSHGSAREVLTAILGLYKRHRGWLHQGTTSYLNTWDPSCLARLVVAKDKTRALLSVAQLETPRFAVPAPLRLTDVDQDMRYTVRILKTDKPAAAKGRSNLERGATQEISGELLHKVGLQLPIQLPDSVTLVEIESTGHGLAG